MDPVSIVFAVLPLLGGAMKAYSSVRKKCKTICRFSRELSRLRGQLKRQHQIFINESHLLIRMIVDDEAAIQRMLEDPHHANWSSKELDTSLKRFLARSYDSYLNIVEEVRDSGQELEKGLSEYERLASARQKGESLKDTEKRLRNRVTIPWTKADFEKTIESLRELNTDLGRLRQQACELQVPSSATPFPGRHPNASLRSEYGDVKTVRRASKALHHALVHAWSKDTAFHLPGTPRHDVKLFAETKVHDGVRMDLAILCQDHHSALRYQEDPSWSVLQVRSQDLEWLEPDPSTPPESGDDRPKNKKRRVRFADESSTTNDTPRPVKSTGLPTPEYIGVETSECESLCKQTHCLGLRKPSLKTLSLGPPRCLGYVDDTSGEPFRHSFYQEHGKARQPSSNSLINEEAMETLFSMESILSATSEASQSVLQQLLLANHVVKTVLKFHSTPWLGDYITANDISFLGKPSGFAKHLDTIHLGTTFTHAPQEQTSDRVMEELVPMSTFEDAKNDHGVRNMTLWCLGTMLLQIACWGKIDPSNDVSMVRRKASLVHSPGPRYQQMTKRCLECDFGFGDDLSQPRLHEAVYKGLICELDDMIRSLDINAGP
ncbi:hypothetical protein PG995_013224 [Apiospora arundinis]